MMRPFFLAPTLVLALALGVHALSGTVQDLSGAPLSDIRVALVPSGASAWTDAEGRWTLGSSSSVSRRSGVAKTSFKVLSLQEGRLSLSVDGRAVDGSLLEGRSFASPAQAGKALPASSIASRSVEASESLYVVHEGIVLARLAIDPSSSTAFTTKVDTMGVEGAPWQRRATYGHFRDSRDGRTYRLVVAGGNAWMAENLDYQPAGTTIPWAAGSVDSGMKYGRLYTWQHAMDLADSCVNRSCSTLVRTSPRGLCPSGWHVPSEEDWDSLAAAVGGSNIAGLRLRSLGGWVKGTTGTDSLGIRLLGSGRRDTDGAHRYQGTDGYFWTRTENSRFDAVQRSLSDDTNYLYQGSGKTDGFAVRCIAD